MYKIEVRETDDRYESRRGKIDVVFRWTEQQRSVVTLSRDELDQLAAEIATFRQEGR
jgi:hypothetical protein